MPDITKLASYAGANLDTDRTMLELHMEAAQRYLEGCGVTRRTGDALYDHAVYMLATHYLDNKGVVQEGGSGEIPMGVNSIMHQLRLEDPETVTDAGGTGSGSEGGAGE